MEKMKDEAGQRAADVETSDRNYAIAAVQNVVGIDDRAKHIANLLEMEVNDEVRIIGIYGTDGIGKTTLAKAVYDRISYRFNRCSFLAEVEETTQNPRGIQFLQTKLIRDILKRDREDPSFNERIEDFLHIFREMKVLIVVDDVEEQSHLHAIVGDQLDRFGRGSQIIVTSKNSGILEGYDLEKARNYMVSELDEGQAFELFCKHAFRMQSSIPDYDGVSNRIVNATEKLPLAVEVVGSFLRGKSIQEWLKMEESMKERAMSSQKTTVGLEEILDICYEALDPKQKDIFLDIACFISGVDARIASYIWPNCYLPSSDCILMPLAKIGVNNELQMHRLLRCLGKRILNQKGSGDPSSRRFCTQDMVLKAMNREKGTENVEAHCFDFTAEDFQSMLDIRFLKLDNAKLSGNFEGAFASLRGLHWQRCPLEFDAFNFVLGELVVLDLSWSKVTEDWGGWRKIEMEKLKVLNLTGCSDLRITPDFSGYKDLEILILERCSGLVELHPSIGHLKRLVSLNLKSCSQLNWLPGKVGRLTALSELSLDDAEIFGLPRSLGELPNLRRLSLRGCLYLVRLPYSIGEMGSLEELDISSTSISELPYSIRNLKSLKVLRMDSSFILKFPREIGNLTKLEELHAFRCGDLEGAIPSDIKGLRHLRSLTLGHSSVSSLPHEISAIPGLRTLDLIQCNEIEELPKLPPSLICLRVSSTRMKAILHLEDLMELEELCLSDGDPKARGPPSAIEEIEGLEGLKALKRLDISNCRIRNLNGIGQLTSLRSLILSNCDCLDSLPDLSKLKSLKLLKIQRCKMIHQIEGLQKLTALESLNIGECPAENSVEVENALKVVRARSVEIWGGGDFIKQGATSSKRDYREEILPDTSKQESSSTALSSSEINYEVFLNFRGEDTRKEFTDLLHKRLKNAGIEVFKNDKKLRAGEEIDQGLKDAIKRSRISIAIFSKGYASSKSCLIELEQMWECRIYNGQTIIPIFYNVSPYDVKRQAGDFATSFKKHEADERVDSNTIQTWKEVLRLVGGLSGYHREDINGGHEAQLVEKVVRRVRQVLEKDDQILTDKLVGIDFHVEEMMRKLGVDYSQGQAIQVCGEDVRVIGICGMPGIGKTTLAKVVYKKIHMLFDGCSFLEGMDSERVKVFQEVLIADLQKEKREPLSTSSDGIKIISSRFTNMKVLIVLDDVHNEEQIQGLARKLTWFGPRSRIIVTTNIRSVLNGFDNGALEEYKVEPMRYHHALQLFRKHAFHGDAPQDVSEYDSLSMDIVKAIGGLPGAIVHQAEYLKRRKNIEIWRSNLEYLKDHPPDREVEAVFEASYKSLDDSTKEIFLDIACFFVGKDERIPSYMWEAWDCNPPREIKHLRAMHFLEDGENNELRMHNLLRDFGRKLVQEKALHKRCRIWNHSDALSILRDGKGSESVEGIHLTVEEGSTVCFACERFHRLSNLRYLSLDRATIQGNTENLLPNLRWLEWRECHSILDLVNMHLKKLLILDLSWSPVTTDSQAWRQIMEMVEELKVLNLQGCVQLPASLNFRAPINLEILILEDCTQLSQIGPFISNLKSLSSLNLRKCSLVKQLPEELRRMKFLRELLIDGTGIQRIDFQEGSLKNLEVLSACDCRYLQDISTIGRLRNLTSLALDGANFCWDPATFKFPPKLQRLSLRNCRKLKELPPSIGKLGLLEVMDLSDTKIAELPQSVKELSNLKTLKMERTTLLQNFPKDIVNLGKLEEIDFSGCTSLEGQVRCDISGLSSLRILRLSSSHVAGLPKRICRLSRLQTLDVLKCDRLHTLPKLPSSLLSLHWGSEIMTVPDLSYLTSLQELRLEDAEQPKEGLLNLKTPNIGWIMGLTSLETLELSLPNIPDLPGNFSALPQLRELSLSYMEKLDITQLPSSSLWTLRLKHCKIQEPKFSGLKYLSELELEDCDLAEIDGLKDLKRLEVLKVFQCKGITNLNGLKDLPRLRKVQGFFSARPSLPELDERVEQDIYPLA